MSFLKDIEVHYLLQTIKHSRMSKKNKFIFFLALFYGCRSAELRNAERKDFDFNLNIWVVPPEKHKTGMVLKRGKLHVNPPLYRPIIPELVPILKEAFDLNLHESFIFPTHKDKAMSIGEDNYTHSCTVESIDAWILKHKGYQMPKWSMHVLRKTMRTNVGDYTEFVVAEAAIGHKLDKVQDVYDKNRYLLKMADMYKRWWDRIQYLSNPDIEEKLKSLNTNTVSLKETDQNWMTSYKHEENHKSIFTTKAVV